MCHVGQHPIPYLVDGHKDEDGLKPAYGLEHIPETLDLWLQVRRQSAGAVVGPLSATHTEGDAHHHWRWLEAERLQQGQVVSVTEGPALDLVIDDQRACTCVDLQRRCDTPWLGEGFPKVDVELLGRAGKAPGAGRPWTG